VTGNAAIDRAAALFGESASRVVVSASDVHVAQVLDRAAATGVPARVVGRTVGNRLRVVVGGHPALDLGVDEAERAWSGAIERYFVKRVA